MSHGAIHLPLDVDAEKALLQQTPASGPSRSGSSTSKAALLAKIVIGSFAIASLVYQLAPTVYYSAPSSDLSWKKARAVGGYLEHVRGPAAEGVLGGPVWTSKQAELKFLAVPNAESARAASHS